MLIDLERRAVNSLPHRRDYDRWRAQLSTAEYEAIIDELHRIMDEKVTREQTGRERAIFNSSYLPGSDWTGTVYQPIYHACGDDWNQARLFYGLLVWEAVQTHDATWCFHKAETEDDRVLGTTYFTV